MQWSTATPHERIDGDQRTRNDIGVRGAREWHEQKGILSLVLEEMVDQGGMETAGALLQWVREWRRVAAEHPVLEEKVLWQRTLDEVWEAAHASLYGDLGRARQHAAAALR